MIANEVYLLGTMFKGRMLYQIPVYQRNYAWTKKNCEILLQDIFKLCDIKKEHPNIEKLSHFLGMVLVSNDKGSFIIDGQQRYITTYVLLKAMYDCTEDKNLKDKLEELLFDESGIYKKEYRLKLKVYDNIESDYKQFKNLMKNKKEDYDKDNNIIKNYIFFCKTIQENADTYTIQELLDALQKLQIVYIELFEKDNDDPQLIFEKINSTGVELTLADLIRNHIFMQNDDAENLYKQYWLDIEKKLNSHALNNFFISYCLYKLPAKTKQNEYYNQFKKMKEEESLSTEALLKEFTKYAKYYLAFTDKEDKSYSKKIRSLLNIFIDLEQTTIFVFLFAVFEDFENKVITEETVEIILKLFISFTVRRAVLSKGTNVLRGLYKGLSTKYKNLSTQTDKNNYVQTIYETIANEMPTNAEIERELPTLRFYKKTTLCKLVLCCLENGLASKETVSTDSIITIEHILPQNPDKSWKKMLGESFDSVYKTYVDTIGNLTLTGYNAEMGNKPFQTKKEYLAEKGKYKDLNKEILNKEVWGEKEIQERAAKLTNRFLKVFSIPKGIQ